MDIEKIKKFFQTRFVDIVKNHYMDFNGRATRSQYWLYVLAYVIISIPFVVIDTALLHAQALSMILSLALLLPSLGIGVRRLHDVGQSGWLYLVAIVPFVGAIALLVLFCLKSQDKDNKYGKKVTA